MLKLASYLGITIVFAWFLVGGITHFTNPDFFVAIMLIPRTTRELTGNLLIALTLAVTPANVHMWMNPQLYPDVEPFFLSLRLVIQAFLLFVIWWSTRNTRWLPQPQTA